MTTITDHNKLLKKIAKERLLPYGIIQKGKSRTFLLDKGWYTVVIEFQPSSWSKGTYLNIGVDLNFYPRDYFAFGYGSRVNGFEQFEDEKQFGKLVNDLCDVIINRVQELEMKFQNIWIALVTVENEMRNDGWRTYEFAFLNALTSNFNQAEKQFKIVSNMECSREWEIARKHFIDEILNWNTDDPEYLNNFKNLIHKTRELKKLPCANIDNITVRKTTPNSTLPRAERSWWQKLFGSK